VRAWLVRIRAGSSTLEALGCGADALLHRRGASVLHLASQATALGAEPAGPRAPEHRVALEPADVIVLASDGVVDALNAARMRYGLSGLERVVLENPSATAAELIDCIRSDLTSYATGPRGDRTLVVIRRLA
jgi:serine phosphatase RsbU (regulator of sigma subunit)